ncbi:hypothetical protein ACFLR0_00070 [Candidatus Bipolaricaulota bacterium]
MLSTHGSRSDAELGRRGIGLAAWWALVLAIGIATFQSAAFAAGDASVWTDKDDCAPGETVAISGAGFEPSAAWAVVVERPEVCCGQR